MPDRLDIEGILAELRAVKRRPVSEIAERIERGGEAIGQLSETKRIFSATEESLRMSFGSFCRTVAAAIVLHDIGSVPDAPSRSDLVTVWREVIDRLEVSELSARALLWIVPLLDSAPQE